MNDIYSVIYLVYIYIYRLLYVEVHVHSFKSNMKTFHFNAAILPKELMLLINICLFHSLQKHLDLRRVVGKAKTQEQFREVIRHIKKASMVGILF